MLGPEIYTSSLPREASNKNLLPAFVDGTNERTAVEVGFAADTCARHLCFRFLCVTLERMLLQDGRDVPSHDVKQAEHDGTKANVPPPTKLRLLLE